MFAQRARAFLGANVIAQLSIALAGFYSAWLVGVVDYGAYASFLGIVGIVSGVLVARWDVLVSTAPCCESAALLCQRFVIKAGRLVLGGVMASVAISGATGWWAPWTSLAVGAAALGSAVMSVCAGYWLHTERVYRASVPRILLGCGLCSLQTILVHSGLGAGLTVGHAVASVMAGAYAYTLIWRLPSGGSLLAVELDRTRLVAEGRILFVTGVLSQIALAAPVLIADRCFGHAASGLLGLAQRLLGLPLVVLGNPLSLLISREVSAGRGVSRRVCVIITSFAVGFAVVIYGFLYLVDIDVFAPGWMGLGVVMCWQVPVFALRLFTIPFVGRLNGMRYFEALLGVEVVRGCMHLALLYVGSGVSFEVWNATLCGCGVVTYLLVVAFARIGWRCRPAGGGGVS